MAAVGGGGGYRPLANNSVGETCWLAATGHADGPSDYAEYDRRKTTARREAQNEQLPVADGGR